MTTLSNQVFKNSFVYGQAELTYKHPKSGEPVTEAVHVVGKGSETDPLSEERYYISGMIAKTAFEDLSGDVQLMPSFEGRSRSELEAYLVKNAR